MRLIFYSLQIDLWRQKSGLATELKRCTPFVWSKRHWKKVSKKLAGLSQYFELGYEVRSSDHATEASACCAYSLLTRVRFPRNLNVLYSPLGHGISWSLHGLTIPEIYDEVQTSALLNRAIHWRATKGREWVISFVFLNHATDALPHHCQASLTATLGKLSYGHLPEWWFR